MTKYEESQQDLKRYYKLLPKQEVYEHREFFYNGIISLDESLNNISSDWAAIVEIIQTIEDTPYGYSELASWCCVDSSDIKGFLNFEIPQDKTLKKIYIGLSLHEYS